MVSQATDFPISLFLFETPPFLYLRRCETQNGLVRCLSELDKKKSCFIVVVFPFPLLLNSISFGQEIVCVTGPNSKKGPVSVTLQHGNTKKEIQNVQFTYSENPTVSKITPEVSIRR